MRCAMGFDLDRDVTQEHIQWLEETPVQEHINHAIARAIIAASEGS